MSIVRTATCTPAFLLRMVWPALFAFLLSVCIGCNRERELPVNMDAFADGAWHPDTQRLDRYCKRSPILDEFSKSMKDFYQEVHDRRWDLVYSARNLNFKNVFGKNAFLKEANGRNWELLNYSVLSVQPRIVDGKLLEVAVVCKFLEGPSKVVNYNYVIWESEGGIWRCDAPGPLEMPMGFRMDFR